MKITIDIDQVNNPIQIHEGDFIEFNTPIVIKKKTQEITIPIASLLQVQEDKIFNYLTKFVGEEIRKGDTIGKKKALFGMKEYKSEIDGIVREINHQLGCLVVDAQLEEETEYESFISGKVVEKTEKYLTVEVKEGKHFSLKHANNVFGGEVVIVLSENISLLTDDDVNNRIVVTQKLAPHEQVKLETLGARGFVTLHTLPENGYVPWAQFSTIPDWEEAAKHQYPYCTIDKKNARIYFYSY